MGQIVACSAEKEHRDRDVAKMLGPFYVRLPRLVKWKREEDQALDAGHGRLGGCRRRHAPAEGMAACEQREAAGGAGGGGYGGTDRRGANFLGVSTLAVFHVREIIADGCNGLLGQALCDRLERRVAHVCARPVAKHEKVGGVFRAEQKRRDLAFFRGGEEFQLVCGVGHYGVFAGLYLVF